MADPTVSAFTFAGYLLAKSVSILAGAPCEELLVPIALVERSNHPEFLVFEAETQEKAVERGLSAMKEVEATAAAWAFAHEGYARSGEQRTDAFFVRLWAKGSAEPLMLVQSWKKQATTCQSATLTRIGKVQLLVDGKMIDLTDEQQAALEQGIGTNPEVASAWKASVP